MESSGFMSPQASSLSSTNNTGPVANNQNPSANNQQQPSSQMNQQPIPGTIGSFSYQGYPPVNTALYPQYMNQHSQSDLDRARMMYNRSFDDYSRDISNFLNNTATNPYKGQSFETLVPLLKNHDPNLLRVMDNYENTILPKNYTSRELGIPYARKNQQKKMAYQAENFYLKEHKKLPVLTGKQIEELANHYGLDHETHQKIRTLILLDDPGRIKNFLRKSVPILGDVVGNFFPTYKPFISAITKGLFGNPTSTISHLREQNPTEPMNRASFTESKMPMVDYVSSQTVQAAETKQSMPEVDFDTVAYDAIATIICPEKYRFRLPLQSSIKTAVASATKVFSLNTDSSGSSIVIINPLNPGSPATTGVAPITPGSFFLATLTGGNPDLGTYTNYTTQPGVFVGLGSVARTQRPSGFSVRIIPEVSTLENSGMIRMAYFQNNTGMSLASGSTDLDTSAITQNIYFQQCNMNGLLRGILLPDQNTELIPTTVGNLEDEVFIINVTGAKPDSIVATIEIDYIYEVQPPGAMLSIMPCQAATPGQATLGAVQSVIASNPAIQMLPLTKATEVARELFNCGPCLKYKKTVALLNSMI